MLAQLKLDESAILEFNVTITGSSESPTYRLIIDCCNNFSLQFPCAVVGDKLEVHLPALKGITEAGEKSVKLEVIVDGKLFVPFNDKIIFDPVIEIESTAKHLPKIEDSIKVVASNVIKHDQEYVSLKKVK